MVELKVGDKAPNFKLQGTDGKTHNLTDYAGKKAVVVAWFPAAFTQGCTIECKSLAEHDSKLDDATKTDIRTKIDAVKQAIDGEDVGEIRTRLEALREASFKLGELVYQQAQQAASTGAPNGAEGDAESGDEEIVDAEVVDEASDRS